MKFWWVLMSFDEFWRWKKDDEFRLKCDDLWNTNAVYCRSEPIFRGILVRLYDLNDDLLSKTDDLLSKTDDLLSKTDHLLSKTDHLLSKTDGSWSQTTIFWRYFAWKWQGDVALRVRSTLRALHLQLPGARPHGGAFVLQQIEGQLCAKDGDFILMKSWLYNKKVEKDLESCVVLKIDDVFIEMTVLCYNKMMIL